MLGTLGTSRLGFSGSCCRLLLLAPSVLLWACSGPDKADTISHHITFSHKASKSPLPETGVLYQQVVESKGDESVHWQFYLDVRSVFCGDDVCRVDPVRLFWNEQGFFSHFTLKEGVTLEKGDGLDFAPQDYPKLQQILANRHSGLSELHKDELVRKQSGGNGADAMTGATVIIRKSDYIEGAIWTCYTLWHYANGPIGKLIRDIVGDAMGTSKLKALLRSNNAVAEQQERRMRRSEAIRSREFALEQLTRLSVADADTRHLVVTLLKRQTPALIGPALKYLETLPYKDYYNAMAELLGLDNIKQLQAKDRFAPNDKLGRAVLASVTEFSVKHEGTLEQKWADRLVESASQWRVYENVNMVFELVKRQGLLSENVKQHYSDMLKHPDFLIARGAFWQLSRLSLSDALKQKVESFYVLNAPKL
ncbi:hypothetical protein Patl_0893 [Paraglaciecola sp. T6c]|uniref:hypothetical protein n=1 Tax=Pseudoalteromonas atlantica (strain T6c / ATCC BAA-1087) TaxID=3042615 RepID=UPI00005C6DA7|nr:hypothetical protein [Paraglaciecola sp. T6c]ABG39419.1 hypothetical protein Patl_0893 [Paraglaciecola sp. T6c]